MIEFTFAGVVIGCFVFVATTLAIVSLMSMPEIKQFIGECARAYRMTHDRLLIEELQRKDGWQPRGEVLPYPTADDEALAELRERDTENRNRRRAK